MVRFLPRRATWMRRQGRQHMKERKMNRLMVIALVSVVFFIGTTAAQAQQKVVPIEAYLCTYVEGKTRVDLDKVTDKWNKWMDDNSATPYTAWVMEPVLKPASLPIEVVWLGAWQNGNAMGKGMQEWITKGGLLQAEFNRVLDCPEHSNAASLNIRLPRNDWPGEMGVAVFANCEVDDDSDIDAALAAMKAWADYMDTTGSMAGMWVFFPFYGSEVTDWDFKIVTSYPDYISFGAEWENYANNDGWNKAMEIGEDIMECDSPRVYHSTTARNGGINPAPSQ